MASILKAVRSPSGIFSRLKHKKLPEEWGDSIKQPVLEGITFHVKYMGSTLVERASGEQATAEAIKTIIAMAKASGRKLIRVAMTVNPKGISAVDVTSAEKYLDVSVYRISFCSADANFDRVVAFIATNNNETFECHAFLCSKRKVAQAAALTISQAFSIAFDLWEKAREEKRQETDIANCRLRDNSPMETDQSKPEGDSQGVLVDLSSGNDFARETIKQLGLDHDHNLDDTFSRVAQSRTHPMLVQSPLKPNDIQDLQELASADNFTNDQVDNLLPL